MFDNLYYPDERDKAVFGDLYNPPAQFNHGEWYRVAALAKESPDGYAVEIDELRMPARFFRLRALPSPNSMGIQRTEIPYLTTGSGDEMGALLLQVARAISGGMLAIHPPI